MTVTLPDSITTAEVARLNDRRLLAGLSAAAARRAREATSAAARRHWARLVLAADARLGELRRLGASADPSFADRLADARDALALSEPQAAVYTRRAPERVVSRPPAPAARSALDAARVSERAAEVRSALTNGRTSAERQRARELLAELRGGGSR